MVSQVISFRVSDDAIAHLKERSKPGESASQTAQRLLNEVLGTTKEVGLEMTVVDSRIQMVVEDAIAPLRSELEALRVELGESVA
jgi:hypothetical protein